MGLGKVVVPRCSLACLPSLLIVRLSWVLHCSLLISLENRGANVLPADAWFKVFLTGGARRIEYLPLALVLVLAIYGGCRL
jgi:hypothetical protein